MPDGDCTGPRWGKRGKGRARGQIYSENYAPNGVFGRIGGFFSGRRENGQRSYSQNRFYDDGRGYGRGKGNGKGHGRGRKGGW